tara:strand:- start:9710 stop:13723 length:4014 start_codon:yes stop_codon:yes gene_type:complete
MPRPFDPVLTRSVEVPFSGRTGHYWAVPESREEVRQTSHRDQALGLALAVTAGLVGFNAPRLLGRNPANFWLPYVKKIEELAVPGTEFRLAGTFRVGDALSASLHRTSPHSILLGNLSATDKLRTAEYLNKFLNVKVNLDEFAEIAFKPTKGPYGQLLGIGALEGSQPTVLHSRIRAMRPGRLFEAFTSIFQPGTFGDVSVPRSVFGGISNTKWVPIPTQGSARDILTGIRAYGAFSVQRLGELIERVGEEVHIPSFRVGSIDIPGTNLKSLFGKVGIKMQPGRASFTRTLLGYGRFAALLGGSAMMLGQLDSWKNADNIFSNVVGVSATTGVAASLGRHIAKTMGKSPGRGMLIGAAASLAQFLPMFSSGLKPGIGGMLPRLNMLRSRIGESFFFNDIRRWFEDTMPGSTSVGGALFMGIGAGSLAYAYARNLEHKSGGLLPRVKADIHPLVRKHQMGAMGGVDLGWLERKRLERISPANVQLVQKHIDDMIGGVKGDPSRLYADSSWAEARSVSHRIRQSILDENKLFMAEGSFLKRELGRLGHAARTGRLGGVLRAGGLAAAAWFLGTGGAGTLETPEELERIYGGEQLIPVRRGRGWEAGATPYEGTDILYWRQHWYPRLVAKSRVSGERGPLKEWLLKNFTYALERENYHDRPYAISGAAFDQIPFIYPLLKPIGDLIKPAKLMHVGEWARIGEEGNIELKYAESALTPSPVGSLGGLAPGAPISPYAPSQMLRRMFYETTELAGLVGYATQGLYSMATGAPGPFAEDAIMTSASEMGSMRRAFWGEQTGGAFMGIPFMSEAVRRFMPAFPSAIQEYNPIENTLPDWLPKDLRYGDPYTSLRHGLGEERLPGRLYDELYGTGGEYGMHDRLRILSDVASYSAEYRRHARSARGFIQSHPDSAFSANMADSIARLRARKQKIGFNYYMSRPSGYGAYDSQGNIRDINEGIKQRGAFRRAVGGVWEGFTHGVGKVLAPLEHLGPGGAAPWSKLMHQRDPVEHYEQTKVYGSQYRFWSHPWKNWIRPAIDSARRHWLGDESIPGHVQETRDIQQHYDMLKWYKYQQLSSAAAEAGDMDRSREYRSVMKSTTFGVNPYGGSSSTQYSLPYSDRGYFEAFSSATSGQTREDILRVIPENQRIIYQSMWNRKRLDYLQRTGADSGELQDLRQAAMAEGRPITKDLFAEYTRTADPGMTYADWSRLKEAEAFFAGRTLPSPNWVGWRPDIDLEDIKLKQITAMGRDHHDFDIFSSRVRVMNRKPYIDNSAIPGHEHGMRRAGGNFSTTHMSRQLRELMHTNGYNNYRYSHSFNSSHRSTSAVDLSINVAPQMNMGDIFS